MAKFIKENLSRFGIWREGKKEKWFDNEEEFYNSLDPFNEKYSTFFQWDINKIYEFFQIDQKM